MPYLLIRKVEDNFYLQVDGGILVFSTRNDILNSFSDFIDSLKKGSACRSVTLLALQSAVPIAIHAPENPQDLVKYFLKPTLTTITGAGLGAGFQGQLVSEEIQSLQADFDIYKCILEKGGLHTLEEHHNPFVDRDTFDALTDGQLGRYENFHGTLDELKAMIGRE